MHVLTMTSELGLRSGEISELGLRIKSVYAPLFLISKIIFLVGSLKFLIPGLFLVLRPKSGVFLRSIDKTISFIHYFSYVYILLDVLWNSHLCHLVGSRGLLRSILVYACSFNICVLHGTALSLAFL